MRITDDLQDARWIHIKGWLFLAVAALAAAAVLIPAFSWQNLLLMSIALWAACRWYYYMFYVVEKYVDPSYRFAGLGDFLRYLLKKRGR